MKYSLTYNINIEFTLSDVEFKTLTECFKNSEYKQDAEIGGFWYGNIGRRSWLKKKKDREECWHTVSTHNSQKLLKSLEPYVTFAFKEGDIRADLFFKLNKMIKAAIDTANSLNTHSGEVEIKNSNY